MDKPILKLHIGLHKTGTTYIQSLLKKHRKLLQKKGILYPLAGLHGSGHSALAVNYIPERTRINLRKSNIFPLSQPALYLRDNILYELGLVHNGNVSAVISAEALALSHREGIERFAEHYRPYFEIQVIVFLRRQDFMAESSRAQAYKVNQVGYTPMEPYKTGSGNYNYIRVLERWGSQFDDKSITVVEYPEKQGSQALKTMSSRLFGLPANLKFDDQRINERLGRDVLEYIFNHSKLVFGTKPYFKAIKRLSQFSSENPTPSKYSHFYSPQERLEILDLYRDCNEHIANRYKPDLFSSCPDIDVNEEWEPYPGLTSQQVAVFDQLLGGITD